MIKHTLLLLMVLLALVSCGKRSSKKLEVDADIFDKSVHQISSETMDKIIQNIASPVEVAALINSLDIPFSESYLANPERIPSITTSFNKAYSLGALSADLGYLNIYEKTGEAVTVHPICRSNRAERVLARIPLGQKGRIASRDTRER